MTDMDIHLMLDDADPAKRKRALETLMKRARPAAGADAEPRVNLHVHSFYSFNALGYSPSHIAWRARKEGLLAAGIVDFDVLDGLEEFIEAGCLLNLRTCAGIETRVFVPELADAVINSPGEPGIAYHMGIGMPCRDLDPEAARFLAGLRETAARRNRELVERVNRHLSPLSVDYDRDVLPMTPHGNATERHICRAYAAAAEARFSSMQALTAFWSETLQTDFIDADLPCQPRLLDVLRARTMKRGGAAYVQPDARTFPLMQDMNAFVLRAGGIPTLTWLDGTSDGEQRIEEWIDAAVADGVAAINIIPARNYTPGVKDRKLVNLQQVIALAQSRDLLVVAGTEMNAPGQPFVDDFRSEELAPFAPLFARGAYVLYAHTLLQRNHGRGYLSPWALEHFPSRRERNQFFEDIGRAIEPEIQQDITSVLEKLNMKLTRGYPTTQHAIQLTGPDTLILNRDKPVHIPGPHQFLAQIEVTGLCFSDLKLLQQFDGHVRKSSIISGLDERILGTIPSYVPGKQPTVPGHETVVRIVAVGEGVDCVKPGDRRLVQTDYRWLKTTQSNAAFGYNFEGALQEYVLMDERVVTAPDGESTLIPAPDNLSASSIALAEPWACVENAYINPERRAPLAAGRALRIDCASFDHSSLDGIADESLDDILFLGADADLLEQVFSKLAKGGLINIVQNGQTFGRPVMTPVGRIHYGGIRITGTTGSDPEEGYHRIPDNGEIRDGDSVHVVGAGGPMGTMHVIRDLCQGVPNLSVTGSDLNEDRLAQLVTLAAPLAERFNLTFHACNAKTLPAACRYSYFVLMAPIPSLVAEALARASEGALINIFAGIPVQVIHPLDLDACIRKKVYFTGTSGSTTHDMKIILEKVVTRRLDTDLSVTAVCGLDGAVEGIRAVEQQTLPGKILVYPACRGLGLTPLTELPAKFPEVAAHLRAGVWTQAAERALLQRYQTA